MAKSVTIENSAVKSYVDNNDVTHTKTQPCVQCGACCAEVTVTWDMGVKTVPEEWTFLTGLGFTICCKYLGFDTNTTDPVYTQKFYCAAPLGIPLNCLKPNETRADGKYSPYDICTVDYE